MVVTYPDDWAYKLAGNLLKDHVPDADIGSLEDNRQFVLLNFNRINNAGLTRDDSFIIIAAPPLKQHPRTVKEQDDWNRTANRLSKELEGCTRIELTLGHSRPMLDYPHAVIDAARVSKPMT